MAFYKGVFKHNQHRHQGGHQLWPRHHQQEDQHQHQRLELWKGNCERNAQTFVIMQSKHDDMWLLCSLRWGTSKICYLSRPSIHAKGGFIKHERVKSGLVKRCWPKSTTLIKLEIDDQYQIYEMSPLRLL